MPRGTGIYEDEPRDELPDKTDDVDEDADAPDATVASNAQEGAD